MLDDSIPGAGSLCVVGNINRDIKTAPLFPSDHLFQDGETSVASIVETIGGGGANSAFSAAALGAKVGFLGKVGLDAIGDRLEQCLKRYGISSHLAKSREHATGTSINLTYANGQRHFVSCLPNNQSLSLADLDLSALSGYHHLYRADIWFSHSMLSEGNKELFQVARRSGIAVSIDLNWDPQWGTAGGGEILERKKAVRAVLPWVTLAHGNVRELNEFADSTDLERTLNLLTDWGVEGVVVHMGERGAGYFHNRSLTVAPPVPASSHVNTTGTGDVLSVCMMLLHHQSDTPLLEKLHLSNSIVSEFIEGKRQLIPPF
jgi:sugar/nucleoside kinase (ribokinase family)